MTTGKLGQALGRWGLSLGLLTLVWWWIEPEALWPLLRSLSPGWVLLALMVTVAQVVLSAWRWRYTSSRLELPLPLRVAVGEYYLATFLNQVLPGGVAGDVNRAWRHGRAGQQALAAANAVLIERLSGQVVLILLSGALMFLLWPFDPNGLHAVGEGSGGGLVWWWLVPALLALLAFVFRAPLLLYLRRLGKDLHRALLAWPAPAVQLTTSGLIVASYLAVFLALAAGLENGPPSFSSADWLPLLPLCAALLLAMALPVTIAGWGVREGVAALLWPLAGLPAEQGVALGVAYGLLVLVSSLPGALMLLRRGPGRDQTAYPNQG